MLQQLHKIALKFCGSSICFEHCNIEAFSLPELRDDEITTPPIWGKLKPKSVSDEHRDYLVEKHNLQHDSLKTY